MGMYTEFHFNARLRKDVPDDVLAILKGMVQGEDEAPETTPAHPLFATDRWEYMLQCDSYYFAADTRSTLRFDEIGGFHALCIRCNLKNYDGEIQKFIDWIMPYIDEHDEMLGFYRYEESKQPTLVFAD